MKFTIIALLSTAYFITEIYSLIYDDVRPLPVTLDIRVGKNNFIDDNNDASLLPGTKLYSIHDYYSETHKIGTVMDGDVEIMSDDLTLVYRIVTVLKVNTIKIMINSKYRGVDNITEKMVNFLEKDPIYGQYKEIDFNYEDLNLDGSSVNRNILKTLVVGGTLVYHTDLYSSNTIIGIVKYGDAVLCSDIENLAKRTIEVNHMDDKTIEVSDKSTYNNCDMIINTHICTPIADGKFDCRLDYSETRVVF